MGRWKKALFCAGLALCLAGCGTKEYQSQVFAMDTFMELTVYGQGSDVSGQQALEQLQERIYDLEQKLSVTREGSDIHNLNENCGQPTQVDRDTAALLERTLELCEQTGGALDLTAYPAVRAWGFTTGDYRVPTQEELAQLVQRIDYTQVSLEGECVTLPQDVLVDLGAVAKGYTGDVLAAHLRELGIDSACLSLGGNVHTVGTNPEGKPWRVGIQDPDTGAALAVVEVTDKAVITSGSYQRYFEEDGRRYWHIIDPATGAPARSGLVSVTVIGSEGTLCDGFSTALFVMGLDEGAQLWRSRRDFEAVWIDDGGEIYVTAGLADTFRLTQAFQDREVTVIE